MRFIATNSFMLIFVNGAKRPATARIRTGSTAPPHCDPSITDTRGSARTAIDAKAGQHTAER